jgi:hypothetical protein
LAATRWDNLGVLPPRATLAKLSPGNASQDVEISPTLLDSRNVQEFGSGHVARSSLEQSYQAGVCDRDQLAHVRTIQRIRLDYEFLSKEFTTHHQAEALFPVEVR